MNQESNVETLYLNTLNPKCFVRVNDLSTNPKILRSPAKLPACVSVLKMAVNCQLEVANASCICLILAQAQVIYFVKSTSGSSGEEGSSHFLRRTPWFQGNGDGKAYKGDNFGLDLED